MDMYFIALESFNRHINRLLKGEKENHERTI